MADSIGRRVLRRILKILLVIFALVLTIALAAALFLLLNPVFGANSSAEDRVRYAERAGNFVSGEFVNTDETSFGSGFIDAYSERSSGKSPTPQQELPVLKPSPLESPSEDELTVTWLGHSTTLVQMSSLNILFDPVLSMLCSPVSFAGTRRYSKPPLTPEELPALDVVIITHEHYDHLDYDTIMSIKDKTERFVVPLGMENDLISWGVPEEKITSLAWWEETKLGSLTITCTSANHYSGRLLIDSQDTLWSSWVLKNHKYSIYESGDTGYGAHFKEIGERYGRFDLVMTDCAQYNMRWHNVHMFPEEAVKAAMELGTDTVMPIHWGAYSLSDHAWDDPAQRFTLAAEENGLEVITPMLGQTFSWENRGDYQNRWWRELD